MSIIRIPKKSAKLATTCDARIIVAGESIAVVSYDADQEQLAASSYASHIVPEVSVLECHPQEHSLFCYAANRRVALADLRSSNPTYNISLASRCTDVSFNYFSANTIAVASGQDASLYDTRTKPIPSGKLSTGLSGSGRPQVAFNPIDRHIIALSVEKSIFLFDVRKPKAINNWIAHKHDINTICWDQRNGLRLATSAQQASVVWSLGASSWTSGAQEFSRIPSLHLVHKAAFAPFGEALATLCSQQNSISLYNVEKRGSAALVASFPSGNGGDRQLKDVRDFSFRVDSRTGENQLVTLHPASRAVKVWPVAGDTLVACRNHASLTRLSRRGSIPSPMKPLKSTKLSVSSIMLTLGDAQEEPKEQRDPEWHLEQPALSAREELSAPVELPCARLDEISIRNPSCVCVLFVEGFLEMRFRIVFPLHYPHCAEAHVELLAGSTRGADTPLISEAPEYLRMFRALAAFHAIHQRNFLGVSMSTLSAKVSRQYADYTASVVVVRSPSREKLSAPSPPVRATSPSPVALSLLRQSVSNLSNLVQVTQMSNILSNAQIQELNNALPFRLSGARWSLEFSSIIDGTSVRTMFSKMEGGGAAHCMLVVEDVHGDIFGGYSSTAFSSQGGYCGTGECFVWKIGAKTEIFRPNSGNRSYVMCKNNRMVGFGSNFALCFQDTCTADYSATYSNDMLSQDTTFTTRCVECWSLAEF